MVTFWTLGCDADDPQRIAAFWALALGYVKESGFNEPDNASIVDPDGQGPAIGSLKVPESKSAKNRLHIDIRVAGPGPWDMAERAQLIRQKVPELVAAGATVIREEWYGDVLGHVEVVSTARVRPFRSDAVAFLRRQPAAARPTRSALTCQRRAAVASS
ncbi:VOC family protein [Micromonospora sp. NPDC005161]